MDHREPLKLHTVLVLDGVTCHIESIVGRGSNAIVYKGWYRDALNEDQIHHVLIKELFPNHPNQKIRRSADGHILVEPEAREMWDTHAESFRVGNEIHLRLLADHPELMVMGANLNSYRRNGTLYSLLGYTGGRSLLAELQRSGASLRRTVLRLIGLLDALEAFHRSGYLHLDISPSNIMLVGREDQERVFLIDYNSARKIGSTDSSYLSCKTGYVPPEVAGGDLHSIGPASDLYSVAAVFYRCLMGRSLTLEETLRRQAPDGADSPMLAEVPQTVRAMVGSILKKGFHVLPRRRYQTIDQMRQAFRELIDRIDCVGVTHWSLWENGVRTVKELIQTNPALRYLKKESGLYPIRLEREQSISLTRYLDDLLAPDGRSGIILAQGGMGKTTLLLHCAMLRGTRYAPTAPAVFYISLNGWDGRDSQYILTQILMRLRFRREENTFPDAMHTLRRLLEQPLRTKNGDSPAVLLLLDGLNEVSGDTAPLVREINELKALAGVRILAASRSAVPELELEPARLKPLESEDIETALGTAGLLLPRQPEVLQLLRTPLILSIYIRAGDGSRQLDIRTEAELMDAYLDALLDKELRQLPDDSPRKWQTDAALNFVLPAIAAEVMRTGGPLTRQQLLGVVEMCRKLLDTRAFQKAFPRWIGRTAEIRGDTRNADAWYSLVIHDILWKQLGLLICDGSERYRVFHQVVEEHLARRPIPRIHKRRRLLLVGIAALCAALLIGYQQYHTRMLREEAARQAYLQQQETDKAMETAIELAAGGYSQYGALYRQLRELTDQAQAGQTEEFLSGFGSALRALEDELVRTPSEDTEQLQVEKSIACDQLHVSWNNSEYVYEYDLLCRLLAYPEERAEAYARILPVLKTWMESEALQSKVPGFPAALSGLLEADACYAAELYHRAVGVHLTGAKAACQENINELIALVPELDAHRDTTLREDRSQLLDSLDSAFLTARGSFEAEYARLNGYIRSMAEE